MKKLLVNGCSFVAGDALFWDQYVKEKGINNLTWESVCRILKKKSVIQLFYDYRFNYRRKKNLPSILAKKLNTDWIDISEDGNSNDSIAFTTIQALLKIPEHERKNYHVVIGWSSLGRSLKYTKTCNIFTNLHSVHLEPNNLYMVNELKNYLISWVKHNYDQDFYYNYIRNVLMLENFLKANQCTYTFYRSMGYPNDCIDFDVWPIHPQLMYLHTKDKKNMYSNDRCWFKFLNNESLGLEGESLASEYLFNKKENWVSKTNSHPNINVIEKFSDRLVEFIKNQNVGF